MMTDSDASAATFLKLSPTAARTGIVSARGLSGRGLPILELNPFHDVGGSPLLAEFLSHKPHVGINVMEKKFVPCAKIVETFLAIRSASKPMFGALPIAGEPHVALPAVPGKRVSLILSELSLLGRLYK